MEENFNNDSIVEQNIEDSEDSRFQALAESMIGKEDGGDTETGTTEDGANPQEQEAERQPEIGTQETEVEQAPEPLLTVKINGEEKKVKQSELIAHYQKAQSASLKLEEVAAQRRAAEEERSRLSQALERYYQELDYLVKANEPDWDKLAEESPEEYVRQSHIFNQYRAKQQEVQQEYERLNQIKEAEQAQKIAEFKNEQLGLLLEKIPEWQDESNRSAELTKLHKFLESNGYDQDVMGRMMDHREFVLARKAMLYDEMLAQKQNAEKEIAAKLQKTPPVKVEKAYSTEVKENKVKESLKRYKQTRNEEDIDEAFISLFAEGFR